MAASDKYGFHPDIEAKLVATCALSERMWNSLGRYINPDALDAAASALVYRATEDILKRTAVIPSDGAIILQRIIDWADQGKAGITYEMVDWCANVLTKQVTGSLELLQLTDIVKHTITENMRYGVVQSALKAYNTGESLMSLVEDIERIESVGTGETSSVLTGDAGIEALIAMSGIKRTPTGVVDLDHYNALKGGMPHGGIGTTLGASGAGKSMLIGQFGIAAVRQGKRVGVVSLELPAEWIQARMMAAVLGWSIDLVEQAPRDAGDLFKKSIDTSLLSIVKMEGSITPVSQVVQWAKRNGPFDMLVVDYADLLAKTANGAKAESSYEVARYVWKYLRAYGEDEGMPIWTASQTKRRASGRSSGKNVKYIPLTVDDVADSMHKINLSDVVLGLDNFFTDDGVEMSSISVLKHRVGKTGAVVGPFPTSKALGYVVPSVFLSSMPEGGGY